MLGGGDALRRELEARVLVITLGADGMLVFDDGAEPAQVAAVRSTEVFDVTGAGDTVIAVLTLGLIAGLSMRRAAELASAAASVVVRRLGVAVASPDEIVGRAENARQSEAAAAASGSAERVRRLTLNRQQDVLDSRQHCCSSIVAGGVFCKQIT